MDLDCTHGNYFVPTPINTLKVPQWGFSTATSVSSGSASPSASKRLWPFEGDQDRSTATSTPPNLRLQTGEISEPMSGTNVCFGSITEVKAQVNNRSGLQSPVTYNINQEHRFPVVEEGAFFALERYGIKFARLNRGLCRTIKSLVTDRQLQLKAFVEHTELVAIQTSWDHDGRKVFRTEINIYGSEADLKGVGRMLAEADIYLQYPRFGLEGYAYHNPHFLPIDGFATGIPVPLPESDTQKEKEDQTRRRQKESDSQGNDSAAVDSILDSDLTHHVDLRQISVDRRISQSLRSHQKEAIDFVSQREIGKLPSELSLWKYNDVDQDEPFYQHVFTGAKRPRRVEAKGGIIADEMGLGKTLVILSTIAGTLDRAQEFVAENQPAEGQTQRKVPSQATLVIVPSSLLVDSWVKEIRDHSYPGAISFHKHLSSARHTERHLLQQRIIVFTTYATVAIDYGREKSESPLSKINWFRIVLDEAHDIRNPATNQFKAVAALTAQHRWCLTGTPIQNSLDDLGALTTFLKVPILEASQTFAKIVKNPINTNSPTRYQNLRVLLKTICLRRTRELLDLPEPVPQIRRISLTTSERRDYDNLLHQGRVQIDMAVSGRRKGRINSTVLESLLKLRLFCNNGQAVATEPTSPSKDPDEVLTYLQQLENNFCAYCSGTVYSLSDVDDNEGGTVIVHSLNLAVATRIYLLEPQWNPSIESQAVGRALRLGQTEQVRITRYITANTVEESNVLDRQKRKLQLAGGGFGKGKDVASVALDIFGVDLPPH
ncbi:Nn.00g032160.m01.CDS01 [Neocucurbitaria sp. VM-36]